jgi:hypothetical protein
MVASYCSVSDESLVLRIFAQFSSLVPEQALGNQSHLNGPRITFGDEDCPSGGHPRRALRDKQSKRPHPKEREVGRYEEHDQSDKDQQGRFPHPVRIP